MDEIFKHKIISLQQIVSSNNIKNINIDNNFEWEIFELVQGNFLYIKSKYVNDFAKLSDQFLAKLNMYKHGILKARAFSYPLRFQMLNLFFSEYVKN